MHGLFLGEQYPTYRKPQSVVTADFNEDGAADLATADQYGAISLLIGRGDGTFLPRIVPPLLPGGGGSAESVVGDFNSDGHADLAIATSSSVMVLLGRGDATFATAVAYGVGRNSASLTVGDLDGDGRTDLAAASGLDETVSVLLGRGDGTFQARVAYAAGATPTSVRAADFDGDGRTDLAVANEYTNHVSILRNLGGGGFSGPIPFLAGTTVNGLSAGDFNGDGLPDLAVINGVTASGGSINILLNRGDCAFGQPTVYDVDDEVGAIAVSDFDADGHLDLTAAVYTSYDSSVVTLGGRGDGTFLKFSPTWTPQRSNSLAVGDFDGDRVADLALAHSDSFAVSVMIGRSDGTLWMEKAPSLAIGRSVSDIGLGDLDGDGLLDLVAANPNVNENSVTILRGRGDGEFAGASLLGVGSFPAAVALADFDGNGSLDIVTANMSHNNISILLNGRGGPFGPAVNYPAGRDPFSLAVGDYNGDGRPDVAVVNLYGSTISVLMNRGDGTFLAATSYRLGSSGDSITTADFDGDGDLDLAVAVHAANAVSVFLNQGGGVFGARVAYPAGSGVQGVAVGDFNGDGVPDLATADSDANTTSILLGKGDGSFRPRVPYRVGYYPTSLTPGDYNGDGVLDLAVVNSRGSNISILPGRGDGTFGDQSMYYGAGEYSAAEVAAADLNRDGLLDLVVGGPTILLNRTLVERPAVDSVVVQGGMGQRSYVDRASWTFSEAVNVGDLIADGSIVDAVGLYNLGMEPGTSSERRVSLSALQFRYDPATRTLTWELAADSAKQSLPDGAYEWRIDAAAITNAAGRTLATNDGASYTSAFHRLLGDASGDGVVDQDDIALINAASGSRPGSSNWDVDADLDRDGSINVRDRLIVQRAMGGRIVRTSALESRAASFTTPDGLGAVGLVAQGTDAADATASPLRPASRGGADRRFTTAMRRGSPALALQRSRVAGVLAAWKAAGLARGSSLADRLGL